MTTNRKPTAPTTEAIDHFCARLDSVFSRRAARQALHYFLHNAPWDVLALNKRRLALWQKRPDLAPHAEGVLIIDATGDRKRGRGIVLAAQQYIGKLGHTANGVLSGHQPLGRWQAARSLGSEGIPSRLEAPLGQG